MQSLFTTYMYVCAANVVLVGDSISMSSPPGPGGYRNDILTATNETAIALANKGMDVRYVYGLDACHTDPRLQLEQRVPALIWAMAPWKEKLAAKKSA